MKRKGAWGGTDDAVLYWALLAHTWLERTLLPAMAVAVVWFFVVMSR